MGKIDRNGRPRKFDDNELLNTVIDYIENEYDKNKPIKITKLAEGLKEKGLNIVYQDLSRYKNVKEYIQEYNSKINPKSVNKKLNSDKKSTGRPRKFDEKQLLIAVKGYVKDLKKPEIIKVTKVAKYFQDKGINITYQDLNRYPEVSSYIKKYNEIYKKELFGGVAYVDIEKQKAIFQNATIEEFLNRNKTTKDIENALLILNTTKEKLVESNDKLQNKIIIQNEKILKQANEIEELEEKIKVLESENKKHEEKLKEENKKLTKRLDKYINRMVIYDQFINRYHYANLAEYAVCLEQGVHADGIKKMPQFIDEEKYAQGNLKLRDIADKYNSFQLAVTNALDNYSKEDDDRDVEWRDISEYIESIGRENDSDIEGDSLTTEKNEKTIESMDLSMDDINSMLSIIDEI